MNTSLYHINGYKIRIATLGFVFIGLLTIDFHRVHQIEVYKVDQSGIQMFQGYAQLGSNTFNRLAGPLLNAAKENRQQVA